MKKASPNNDGKLASKKGKSLKEKIKRHIMDKNDVITEQDLKEVIVGVDAVDLKQQEEPTFDAEDIPPQKIISPWDIVDGKK